LALPIFFFNDFVSKQASTSSIANKDAQTRAKNSVLIYSAVTSIIYGLGKGLYLCGIFSYTAVISESCNAGKNFGYIWSAYALQGYLKTAIAEDYFLGNFSSECRMWIMVLVAILALSLSNPQCEDEILCVIG
jgi:hypothetical protein